MCVAFSSAKAYFYPRPPRGGRPAVGQVLAAQWAISIHALREEGDRTIVSPRAPKLNFYPRPPRGGRPPAGPLPECRH